MIAGGSLTMVTMHQFAGWPLLAGKLFEYELIGSLANGFAGNSFAGKELAGWWQVIRCQVLPRLDGGWRLADGPLASRHSAVGQLAGVLAVAGVLGST